MSHLAPKEVLLVNACMSSCNGIATAPTDTCGEIFWGRGASSLMECRRRMARGDSVLAQWCVTMERQDAL
eukprot:CAMPEP_0180650918 /NCGR_PEP_ID=MMETSP1037_2-20121125/52539_1 /TAXON_ID=632150 /ORGANISM="Azadinium spinosum, Strain 3D9" /LENGTH=69 /DNA_ID=CAMNT_0022676395 /DNA_START=27 /DNA_END=233 /DNA_ORIENTATION=+